MPGIKDVNLFTIGHGSNLLRGVKDGHGDNDEDDSRQYCQSCLQYGIRSPLKKRMYKVEAGYAKKVRSNTMAPKPKLVPANVPDADRFRQCYHCGDIVPIYNVKYESKIEDFVQTIDNPFDSNPGNMEGFTPGIGKSNRLNKSRSIYKRKKAYIESIKDEDIRRELEKGNQVTIHDYQ